MQQTSQELERSLRRTCSALIGRRVRFKGTNYDENDKAAHGKPVSGVATVKEVSDRGPLLVALERDDIARTLFCIKPTSVSVA